MSDQLPPLRRTPCKACRQRKRRCSYEQPCARCLKAGTECVYEVIPSPKDLEYIQELKYITQINELEHQIATMENELAVLKISKENEARRLQMQQQQQSSIVPDDYPSPISLHDHHDDEKQQIKRFVDRLKSFEPSNIATLAPISPPQFLDFDKQLPPAPRKPISDSEAEHQQSCREESREKKKTLFVAGELEADISKKAIRDNDRSGWTLTVRNGNLSIHTSIASYTDLMDNLSRMLPIAVSQFPGSKPRYNPRQFPFNLMPLQGENAIGMVIGVLVWRNYSKSRLKSMNKIIPRLKLDETKQQQLNLTIRMSSSVEQLTTITMRLLFSYFHCSHLMHFSLYVPEFVRRYMQPDTLLSSSAVMALCSALCRMPCRHLYGILPADALLAYSAYYFEQARLLIEEKFDDIDLESMITYKYMAIHKLKTKEEKEADRYLCLAERMYNLLLPQYGYKKSTENKAPQSAASMLFHRVYRGIRYTRLNLEVQYIMANLWSPEQRVTPQQLFSVLSEKFHDVVEIYPGDSEREKQFAKMRYYLCAVKTTINEAAQYAAASDYPTYIGVLGHQIEMGLRHCYKSVLPADYQLSVPLFEDTMSDVEFFTALENDYINRANNSPIPMLTAVSIYHEYLIMAKSYVPKCPMEASVNTEELLRRFKESQYGTEHPHFFSPSDDRFQKYKVGRGNCHTHDLYPRSAADKLGRSMTATDVRKKHGHQHTVDNWMRLIFRIQYMKKEQKGHFTDEELQESDEVYISKFIKALDPSKLNFDLPIVNTSVRVAFNIVRLVQFLLSKPESVCLVDINWIYSAWEILLRAARFRYQQHFNDSNNPITLERIHANLILCLNMMKSQLALDHFEPNDPFIHGMEERFNSVF